MWRAMWRTVSLQRVYALVEHEKGVQDAHQNAGQVPLVVGALNEPERS
jgi:hypothetical protein